MRLLLTGSKQFSAKIDNLAVSVAVALMRRSQLRILITKSACAKVGWTRREDLVKKTPSLDDGDLDQ
jgi:hypothetical protein